MLLENFLIFFFHFDLREFSGIFFHSAHKILTTVRVGGSTIHQMAATSVCRHRFVQSHAAHMSNSIKCFFDIPPISTKLHLALTPH